jgi:uncharacterized membrane protein
MNKFLIFLIILIAIPQIVNAATIEGKVYNLSLNRLDNVIVEINTEPIQRMITENGEYSFNIGLGTYIINVKSKNNELIASENITIKEEGTYNLDLIMKI